MADHRAEQIVAAVKTLVTGLATTTTNVDRGRDDEVAAEKTPALRVRQGEDVIVEPWAHALLDSELEVIVEALVYDSAANVETKLNQIRKEVNIVLVADHTLGLSFVQGVVEMKAERPQLGTDQAKPSGSMEMIYRVLYRRSRLDPSQ
jgi:hypothetical protein